MERRCQIDCFFSVALRMELMKSSTMLSWNTMRSTLMKKLLGFEFKYSATLDRSKHSSQIDPWKAGEYPFRQYPFSQYLFRQHSFRRYLFRQYIF